MNPHDRSTFTGRDLSRIATFRHAIVVSIVAAVIVGGIAVVFAHDSGTDRPMRGSVATLATGSVNLNWSDVAGLLGASLVALLPLLQAMRCFTSRSVAGLSQTAWLLSFWVMLGAVIQGANDSDEFLVALSLVATVGVATVLAAFMRYSRLSLKTVSWTLVLAVCSAGALLSAAEFDSLMWLACLVGVVPVTIVIAIKMMWALIASPSRRGASQAVNLVGAIGYTFWFVQAIIIENVPMAATALIMVGGFVTSLGLLLYLGVVSDDGASAADIVLYRQVKGLPRAIAMHSPVFDPVSRMLVDVELQWANDNWQSYRTSPVPSGALGSQHRVRFNELLPYLQQAWTDGKSVQYFRLDRDKDEQLGHYAYSTSIWGADIEVETLFVRLESGLILEWGDDLDAKTRLGSELERQRQSGERERLDIATRLAAQTEHSRFSRELHDNILQELFVMSMRLEMARSGHGLSSDEADQLHGAIGRVSTDIRSLIDDSSRLEAGGQLVDQVAAIVSSWSALENRSSLPSINLIQDVDGTIIERLPTDYCNEVVSIAREAISNAMRHSQATHVTIELRHTSSDNGVLVALRVLDNGVGVPAHPGRRSGLANMNERASGLGGTLNISPLDPSDDKRPGSVVELLAPLPSLSPL